MNWQEVMLHVDDEDERVMREREDNLKLRIMTFVSEMEPLLEMTEECGRLSSEEMLTELSEARPVERMLISGLYKDSVLDIMKDRSKNEIVPVVAANTAT